MEPQTEIGLETIGDVTLFEIQGDVTAFSKPSFDDAYMKANDRGSSKILLRFEKNAYINSGGISLLIEILAEAKKNNQLAGVTGLSDHFKKIFNMVGITKFAKIYNTLDDALEAMSGP